MSGELQVKYAKRDPWRDMKNGQSGALLKFVIQELYDVFCQLFSVRLLQEVSRSSDVHLLCPGDQPYEELVQAPGYGIPVREHDQGGLGPGLEEVPALYHVRGNGIVPVDRDQQRPLGCPGLVPGVWEGGRVGRGHVRRVTLDTLKEKLHGEVVAEQLGEEEPDQEGDSLTQNVKALLLTAGIAQIIIEVA